MGRNFEELYRAIIALQTADTFEIATPADWQPGDDVIVPTAGSCGVAKARMETPKPRLKDWFFCTKNSINKKYSIPCWHTKSGIYAQKGRYVYVTAFLYGLRISIFFTSLT